MSNSLTHIEDNDFYSMIPTSFADVSDELDETSTQPGAVILNRFLSSGHAIVRFSTDSSEHLNYFYKMVTASLFNNDLKDQVWIRRTVFSTDHGFSFIMFNLSLCNDKIRSEFRNWRQYQARQKSSSYSGS